MPPLWTPSLLVWALLIRLSWPRCVHDDIAMTDLGPGIFVHDGNDVDSEPSRVRRDAGQHSRSEGEGFEPLRVRVLHVDSVLVSRERQDMVKTAVSLAVRKIQSVLSVVPVKGPLLLPRTSCSSVLSGGINKGRCSRIPKGYSGEICLNMFKIPDRHLGGLWLYNRTHPHPVRQVKRPGPGVEDADIIIYVTTSDAHISCAGKDKSVLAFAAYCSLDNTTGRPLSGLVNFCPHALNTANATFDLLYTTALHEIIHVLGFSTSLFDKFLDCTGERCERRQKGDYLRKVGGRQRLIHKLILPTVVNRTSQHFGCLSDPFFGGLLETRNSEATSHWDSLMMHTSIMTPETQNVSYPALDPITLAVLEDSGWYKVNFSNADTFLWGKDTGCMFGSANHCQQYTDYFCFNITNGCHYLLRDRAMCIALFPNKPCGVYARVPQGSCVQQAGDSKEGSAETISPSSRCFVSSVTTAQSREAGEEEFSGQCYERQCTENGTVLVRLRGSQWTPCPPGHSIQVPGFRGQVLCPNNTDILCMDDYFPPSVPKVPQPKQDTSTSTTESTTMVKPVSQQPTHTVTSSAPERICQSWALKLVFVLLLCSKCP